VASLEKCLWQSSSCQECAAQSSGKTFQSLRKAAIRELGPSLAPQMFLDLQQGLQLEVFPSTLLGKQKKIELADRVREYLRHYKPIVQGSGYSTEDVVAELWSNISGVAVEDINRSVSVFTFVDSISAMQFSCAIK
jgi:hypothetical protein